MQDKVSEPTPLYEYPPVRKHMSPEDVALCQQAIERANSGQKHAAYEQFCSIRNHGNLEDVTLLYWIAFTTPSLEEAQQAIDTIARTEPSHPKLQELQAYVDRKRQRQDQKQYQQQVQRQQQQHMYASPRDRFGAVLQCPYCRYVGPACIQSRISSGQVIAFVILLNTFLSYMLDTSSEWRGRLLCMCSLRCETRGINLRDPVSAAKTLLTMSLSYFLVRNTPTGRWPNPSLPNLRK